MRTSDEGAMPPEVAAALLAVDATLAGEPVDPEYADLAKLALILDADRPVAAEPFTSALDERVELRFARPARPARSRARRTRGWLLGSAAGLAGALAAVVVVVVLAGHGGGASSASSSSASALAAPSRSAASHAAASAAGAGSASATATQASAGSSAPVAPARSTAPLAPAPVPSGKRQIVQSAQLQLSTAPARIDDVSQQVFNVVATEKGIVQSSNVTATGDPSANAEFQLSVPSANLAPTLNALSSLHGANVVSRSDATNDITGQIGGAGQRLAEARALRSSLLKQLAAATTTAEVQSIQARLHDADASIASDLSTLRGLQHQVAYSQIAVNIQATAAAAGAGSSFTIGRALHDAGRVLVVVAGAALIALAVMIPVGLVAALLAWASFAIRRRRREQALDLV
jgi:Domain of unknown function (DUF4349)